MTNLLSSVEQTKEAGAGYLARRGFVGRLQLLRQLTGAVTGCVMERQRTRNEINSLVGFSAALIKGRSFWLCTVRKKVVS